MTTPTTMPLDDVRVVAGILWRGRKLLCCCRPDGKPHAGFWEFPGGKVEGDESEDAALRRELDEELGVAVRAPLAWRTIVHEYPERGIRVHITFFNVTDFEGEPTSREGQGLLWMDYLDAPSLDFLPADAGLVRELEPPAR